MNTLKNMGITQLYGKGNCVEALSYYQQALTILETSYPSYHAHIADILDCIGSALCQEKKYNEALDFHYRALEMREDYYSFEHIETTSSLIDIGDILE